jgi:hypothetical protein
VQLIGSVVKVAGRGGEGHFRQCERPAGWQRQRAAEIEAHAQFGREGELVGAGAVSAGIAAKAHLPVAGPGKLRHVQYAAIAIAQCEPRRIAVRGSPAIGGKAAASNRQRFGRELPLLPPTSP